MESCFKMAAPASTVKVIKSQRHSVWCWNILMCNGCKYFSKALQFLCFFISALFAVQTMSPGSSKEKTNKPQKKKSSRSVWRLPTEKLWPRGSSTPTLPVCAPPPSHPVKGTSVSKLKELNGWKWSRGQPDGLAALDRHQAAVRTQETHEDFPSYLTETWLVFCLSSHLRNPPATGSQMINKQKWPDVKLWGEWDVRSEPGTRETDGRDEPVKLTARFMRWSDQQMVYLSKMDKLCLEMFLWGKRRSARLFLLLSIAPRKEARGFWELLDCKAQLGVSSVLQVPETSWGHQSVSGVLMSSGGAGGLLLSSVSA